MSRVGDTRSRWLFVAPATATIVVFMVLPMLLMAFMSVLEPGSFGGVKWGAYSLGAYEKFLFERDLSDQIVLNTDYLSIFARSFWLSGLTTVLCVLAAFPAALFMALQTPKRRQVLLLLVSVAFWTNLLVRVYSWILLLRNNGLVQNLLEGLGVQGNLNVLYTDTAVLIGLVYAFLPFMVLPIYTSLEKLDWRLLEAAFDLGARPWRALWRVVVPLAMPGVVSGSVLVFVPALGSYFVPELLGGSKSLMIGSLIQNQFGASRNWPFGAALSFALLGVVLVAMLVFNWRKQKQPGVAA